MTLRAGAAGAGDNRLRRGYRWTMFPAFSARARPALAASVRARDFSSAVRRTTLVLLAAGASSLGACERGPALDAALAEAPLPAPDAPVDTELADAGAWYFQRNCVACHSVGGGDGVGPDLEGISTRRSPAWIEAMIRRPDSMLVNDSIARALLQRYQVPMLDRQLDGARVRAIMEFLRRADQGPEATAEGP